jgi:hypothetical protein
MVLAKINKLHAWMALVDGNVAPDVYYVDGICMLREIKLMTDEGPD